VLGICHPGRRGFAAIRGCSAPDSRAIELEAKKKPQVPRLRMETTFNANTVILPLRSAQGQDDYKWVNCR
jgi:hypothetical protein